MATTSNSVDSDMDRISGTREGWVSRKVGTLGSWKSAFACLHCSELIIKKTPESSKAVQRICIDGHFEVKLVSRHGKPCLKFDSPGHLPIFFFSDDSNEIYLWFQSIRNAAFGYQNLSISDFDSVFELGRGFFSTVTLMRHRESGQIFAVKRISKSLLNDCKAVNTVFSERDCLMKCSSPFIIRLHFCFQTSSDYFLGLEFGCGGDLFSLIDRSGLLSIEDARIYLAEVAIALHHIHSKGFVYRDVKPENILIGSDGHLKLSDFGLSKYIGDDGHTKSCCGTAAYLSPESVRGEPYGISSDWWSFGVMAFQLLFGCLPFKGSNRDTLLHQIVFNAPLFPSGSDPVCVDFVCKLLAKEPNRRIGFDGISKDAFFGGIDFSKVESKEYCPSFVPDSRLSAEELCHEYFDSGVSESKKRSSFVDTAFAEFSFVSPDFPLTA